MWDAVSIVQVFPQIWSWGLDRWQQLYFWLLKNLHSQVEGTVILPGTGGYFGGSNAKLALCFDSTPFCFFSPTRSATKWGSFLRKPICQVHLSYLNNVGYQKKSLIILKLLYLNQQCNPVITDKETNLISHVLHYVESVYYATLNRDCSSVPRSHDDNWANSIHW